MQALLACGCRSWVPMAAGVRVLVRGRCCGRLVRRWTRVAITPSGRITRVTSQATGTRRSACVRLLRRQPCITGTSRVPRTCTSIPLSSNNRDRTLRPTTIADQGTWRRMATEDMLVEATCQSCRMPSWRRSSRRTALSPEARSPEPSPTPRLVSHSFLPHVQAVTSPSLAGDFSAAIDTLVTAIGLIKQSKVSHEERCKVIVASLQDTLHSIETQASFSSRRSERDRHSRDRHHRSSRSPRREKSGRRERSRSREYRSRERDSRYHDDRYHEDHRRDRERDHRRH